MRNSIELDSIPGSIHNIEFGFEIWQIKWFEVKLMFDFKLNRTKLCILSTSIISYEIFERFLSVPLMLLLNLLLFQPISPSKYQLTSFAQIIIPRETIFNLCWELHLNPPLEKLLHSWLPSRENWKANFKNEKKISARTLLSGGVLAKAESS